MPATGIQFPFDIGDRVAFSIGEFLRRGKVVGLAIGRGHGILIDVEYAASQDGVTQQGRFVPKDLTAA